MEDISKFWDEKFAECENLYGLEPNSFIKDSAQYMPKNSHILCLAEGEGRNALHLADLGHKISAIEISQQAIKNMQNLFDTYGYDINIKNQNVLDWEVVYQEYDAITCTYLHMLNQNQFHQILDKTILALHSGGVFFGEFFEKKQIEFSSGGPKNLDMLYCIQTLEEYLIEKNIELIQLSNETVELEEGIGHQGKASVIRLIFKKL